MVVPDRRNRFQFALQQLHDRRRQQQQQNVQPGEAIEMQAIGASAKDTGKDVASPVATGQPKTRDQPAPQEKLSPESLRRRQLQQRYVDAMYGAAGISHQPEARRQRDAQAQGGQYRFPQMIHGWSTQAPANWMMGGLRGRQDPYQSGAFQDYDQISRRLRHYAPDTQAVNDEDMARLNSAGIEFGRKIGSGAYGSIWEATVTDETGFIVKPMVVKRLAMADFQAKAQKGTHGYVPYDVLMNVVVECRASKFLIENPHPNIVGCEMIWRIYQHETQFPDPISLLLFLERCDGDIYNFIDGQMPNAWPSTLFTEDDARKLFIQIGNAVQHIHQLGMAHRDIKPENIMYSKHPQQPMGKFFLGDFGLSRKFDDPNDMTSDEDRGTPLYQPPEMQRNGPMYNPPFNSARHDVYALGATCLISMIGFGDYRRHPVYGRYGTYTYFDTLCGRFWNRRALDQRDINFLSKLNINQAAAQFFHQVLSGDKNTRPFIGQALQSYWAQQWQYEPGFVQLSFLS